MSDRAGTHFCPSCGARVGGEDRFCRSCGHELDGNTETVPDGGLSPQADVTPPGWRARWVVLAGMIVAIGAVAAVIFFTVGKPGSSTAHANRVKKEEAAFVALKARVYPAFTTAMGQRTKFFIAEAEFLQATRDANSKIKKYQAETQKVEAEDKQIQNANSGLENSCRQPESNVACPNPTYPEPPFAPSVSSDVGSLHHAVSSLSSLNAEVLAISPQSEVHEFYAQLQAAISSLSSDAQANANILSEGITEPTSGSHGYVEEKKLTTIHPENGLPSVKLMNRQAVTLIQMLHLDITQYDVPGGTDVNPSDHSNVE